MAEPSSRVTSLPPRQAAAELLFVAAVIAVAWAFSRFLLYPALKVPDNAPVILRPITGFFAAFWLLRRRGQSYHDVGFRMPSSVARAALVAALLYGLQTALSEWFTPWLASVLEVHSQGSFMGYVRGNLVAFLGWLAIGWVVGGFMEELLFRGFLLERTAEACGGGRLGLAAGVVGQALCFGALHLYGGAFNFVHAAVFAVASGVIYLLAGRNLWPLIVVHGVWNMLGIYSVYAS